jgi:hypothetical protein
MKGSSLGLSLEVNFKKIALTISALAPLGRPIASPKESPTRNVINAVDPVETGSAVAGAREDAEASTTGAAVGLCEARGGGAALKIRKEN